MTNWNLENLHLLRSFKAIAEEGNVVAAAGALGVTQSAVSKHLARLREWLGDPLFVRTARGMQPTPRALELMERVDTILGEVGRLTETGTVDPARFEGVFTISATDLIHTRLLPDLVARLAERAPRLRLTALPLAQDYSLHALETGAVNLLVAVNWHAPGQLRQRKLHSDRFVCVLHRDHPLADCGLTAECYAKARHVLVAPLGMRDGFLDPILAERGLSRHISVSVPSFCLMSPALIGTDRIATLPWRAAQTLVEDGALVIRALPFAAPQIDYHLL